MIVKYGAHFGTIAVFTDVESSKANKLSDDFDRIIILEFDRLLIEHWTLLFEFSIVQLYFSMSLTTVDSSGESV